MAAYGNGENFVNKIITAAKDIFTDAISVLDISHKKIHEGNYYSSSTFITIPGSSSIYFSLKTSSKFVHHKPIDITSNRDGILASIYEGGSINITGLTTFIPTNRNRNSNNVSTVIIYDVPFASIISLGTDLNEKSYTGGGSGVGNTSIGSNTYSKQELNLKPNTFYIAKYDNLSTDPTRVGLYVEWYEI